MNKFKEINVSDELISILNSSGIKQPTPIQTEAIPLIKNGNDLIAQAQTGTGKTLAFLLPIFENMKSDDKNIQTLIITPTRELALQITEAAQKLNTSNKFNILSTYGGKEISGQIEKLSNNTQMVIGTPGRLLDHIRRKTIDLTKIKTLVLDEADQMLLMGFRNEIDAIIEVSNKKRQTLCFSATIDSAVKKLAYRICKDPKIVVIESEDVTLKNIDQFLIETTDRRKLDMLAQVLNKTNPFMAIIFCRTKVRVDNLEEALFAKGFSCQKLHSDIPQAKREKIMKSFKNVEFQYLIATDVAARGLDITGITHIYNYDIPENAEGYIHRIGRTGRAGENGQTYLFIDPKDMKTLEAIEENIKMEIPRLELEYIQNIVCENELPKTKYNKRINSRSKKAEDIRKMYK
ncbi:DEAD/DEAH box helicase [Cetobacterium sp. 2A]|uniref:DEAD/DEAH box helicase n=1 Tax=unclassified Cetobacterium TaxID=2630983 RepID=UPI00163C86A8|nr:DEAD/DEAH box helicase [Cetobacterium sp. 2A]MBC2857332.1 DEAD/DEAH box helicase [Cetobacterium sp. 2A]